MATEKDRVIHKLGVLNKELDALISTLAKYNEAQLNARPTPDTWSAFQNMHHLMLAEKYALAYCEKKLSFAPSLPRAGIGTRIRSWIIRYYDRLPIKAKAPKLVSTESLPNHSTLAEIETQWRQQRAELAAFLEAQPALRYQQEVLKHPFAGRLDFAGMLDFFTGHFRRHRQQALRALAEKNA